MDTDKQMAKDREERERDRENVPLFWNECMYVATYLILVVGMITVISD